MGGIDPPRDASLRPSTLYKGALDHIVADMALTCFLKTTRIQNGAGVFQHARTLDKS